ncbi:MAG: TRAP transporter substrate-binding protein DctP [Lachnospiraceae bacterium]|nr:TRAP transporter substrate-binding protein DctP [Lachnospiraceae bacterium]
MSKRIARLLSLVLAAMLVLSLAACQKPQQSSGAESTKAAEGTTPEAKPSGDQIILRLAEIHVEDYPTTKAAYEMARLVEERTNGRIKIEVYYGGQLGDEASVIEQVQFGAIDMARVSLSPVTEHVSSLNVLQLPYIWRDSDHFWKVLKSDLGDSFLKSIDDSDSGLIGLNWYDPGARNFLAPFEINSVADLKGKKVRVMQSKLMMDMIEALGASPVPIPAGEVYSSIQTGIVDCAENALPGYMSLSWNEVAKYYTLDEHQRVPEITVMSKKTLEKLSAEDQALIRQAAKEATDFQISLWGDKEAADKKTALEKGVVFIEVDEATKNGFYEAMSPLYKELNEEEKKIVEQIRNVQ